MSDDEDGDDPRLLFLSLWVPKVSGYPISGLPIGCAYNNVGNREQ
jgi:hypothetical protein